MTILSCQKRHHEPHPIHGSYSPEYGHIMCLGRAVWPYARPKPPRGNDYDYDMYMQQHGTIGVWKSDMSLSLGPWDVDQWCKKCNDIHFNSHDTHAEAIQYAQNLVNERRDRESATRA